MVDSQFRNMYIRVMLIVWDEPKRLSNLNKHELDFVSLTQAFFVEATILPARKNRHMAIGYLDDEAIIVVFKTLGTEAVSVLSMRPANKTERRLLG